MPERQYEQDPSVPSLQEQKDQREREMAEWISDFAITGLQLKDAGKKCECYNVIVRGSIVGTVENGPFIFTRETLRPALAKLLREQGYTLREDL